MSGLLPAAKEFFLSHTADELFFACRTPPEIHEFLQILYGETDNFAQSIRAIIENSKII